jgi:hypothetical protein
MNSASGHQVRPTARPRPCLGLAPARARARVPRRARLPARVPHCARPRGRRLRGAARCARCGRRAGPWVETSAPREGSRRPRFTNARSTIGLAEPGHWRRYDDAHVTRSGSRAPAVSDVILRVTSQTTGRGDLCGAAFIGLSDYFAATALASDARASGSRAGLSHLVTSNGRNVRLGMKVLGGPCVRRDAALSARSPFSVDGGSR